MKDKRFWFGVTVSVAWVCIGAYVLRTAEPPGKLNEWGDFIAGFSAPLAFFWLVLGYMQQGDELKNNTKALELQANELKLSTDALNLQAQELKNSVEQQMQLVDAAREQIRIDTEILVDEQRARRRNALPRFVASATPLSGLRGMNSHKFSLKNVGQTATNVQISYSGGGSPDSDHLEYFAQDREYSKIVNYRTDCEFEMQISFEDASGEPGVTYIKFKVTQQALIIGKPATEQ